jgi:rubrerythrin
MMKRSKDRKLLQEKEEKIVWLTRSNAENEQRHTQREQELEKEILKQAHTIETLELRMKEGTKNQVVSKIEELQNRRQTAQGRPAAEA